MEIQLEMDTICHSSDTIIQVETSLKTNGFDEINAC